MTKPTTAIPEEDENSLRHRHAFSQLDSALSHAPIGFVLVDLECRYIKVNAAMTAPTGRDPSLYVGKTVREMVPQIADLVADIVRRISETGQPILNYEIKVGNFCQLLNSYPVRDADGKLSGVCSFVLDITDKKMLEASVHLERRRLADFIEQMPGLVWEGRKNPVGGAFETVLVNAFPSRVLGYSSEELLKNPDCWKKSIHPEDREKVESLLQENPADKNRMEYRCLTPDGRTVFLESDVLPILDRDGKLIGYRSVSIDVSEKKAAESERARLVEALSRSLSLRDEFIAVAAHELKTPLAILMIASKMISEITSSPETLESNAEKLKEFTGSFSRQLNSLNRLINDMLVIRKNETVGLSMEFEILDLSNLVGEVVEVMNSDPDSPPIRFQSEPGASYKVRGDRVRLGQVLNNLIANAIKYGAGRPFEVSLGRRDVSIELAVRDQGVGIASKDQARIFELYERVGEQPKGSGLGLGLYIVREIVRAHEGVVEVESRLGEGSCFRVLLPEASRVPR